MVKPLWALTGIALLGTAGIAGAVVVASQGGEEEVVQQVVSDTPRATASLTPAPSPSVTATTPPPTAEATPQPVPEDWQTYTDEVLGFSLRYPPDLVPEVITAPDSPEGLSERVIDMRSSDRHRAFSISTSDNPRGFTLEQWASEYTCPPDDSRSGTVADKAAILCTTEGEYGRPRGGAVFEHGGKMFDVTYTFPDFDQVLSTFEFGG